MDNEKINSDFDELYKRQMENLPEEESSEKEWEQLRGSLQKEGLLKTTSSRRKYFLLFLLAGIIGGVISIPLLTNQYSLDLSFLSAPKSLKDHVKQEVNNKTEKIKANQSLKNKPEEAQQKTLTSEDERPEIKDDSHNKKMSPAVSALTTNEKNKTAKSTKEIKPHDRMTKDASPGKNESSRAGDPLSTNEKEKVNKSVQTISLTEPVIDRAMTVDSNIGGQKAQAAVEKEKNISADSAISPAKLTEEKKQDTAQAVTTEVNETPIKKSWIGIFASWDVTSYHLKENNNIGTEEVSEVFNSSGIEGNNSSSQYTLGIMGGLRVSRKFALEAGVFYSQKKRLNDIISTRSGTNAEGVESFSDVVYNYNAKYIEVRGRIKYYFFGRKNLFYATAGAMGSFNFPSAEADKGYFERTTFSEAASPTTDRVTLEASSAGLSVIVSAGMEIYLSGRWNLFVEPAYTHALTSVIRHPSYDEVPVEHFWRTFSFGTGLMYKF